MMVGELVVEIPPLWLDITFWMLPFINKEVSVAFESREKFLMYNTDLKKLMTSLVVFPWVPLKADGFWVEVPRAMLINGGRTKFFTSSSGLLRRDSLAPLPFV